MSTPSRISKVVGQSWNGYGSLWSRSIDPKSSSRWTGQGVRRALSSTTIARSDATKRLPHITLYTGTDCSLCDVVKETLLQAQSETEFTVEYYNIRDDSMPDVQKWRRQYQYDIPVCHLNGKEIARHRLDKGHLLQQVAEATMEERDS